MRRPNPVLSEELREHPYRFSFVEAIRHLERLAPEREPVGHDGPPGAEVVKMVQCLSTDFPASAVHDLVFSEDETARPTLAISFLGFVGPKGVLPRYYNEELQRAAMTESRRRVVMDFLDLFHHRLASLFFRACEKYSVAASWDRSERERARRGHVRDDFSEALRHLIGLGPSPLRERFRQPDASLLYYSGLLSSKNRSAAGLRTLLRHALKLPVEILAFTGHWLTLEPDQQACLKREGQHNRLGRGAVAGRMCWDDASRFEIQIGPLGREDFRSLLPGGARHARLADLVNLYTRNELHARVRLTLRSDEVPAARLGKGDGGAELGRVSWLRRPARSPDAADASYLIRAHTPAILTI